MSVQFNATAWLSLASSLDYNANYTVTGWVRPEGFGSYIGVWSFNVGSNNADDLYTTTAPHFETESYLSSVETDSTGTSTPAINTWYFVAMRRISNTNVDLYVSTAVEASTASASVAARMAANSWRIGTDSNGSPTGITGRMAQVRLWTTNLSDAELATEKQYTYATASVKAAHPGALWAEYRLVNAAGAPTDFSGNSRTLTVSGTPTDGADDPTGQTAGDGSGGGGGSPSVNLIYRARQTA